MRLKTAMFVSLLFCIFNTYGQPSEKNIFMIDGGLGLGLYELTSQVITSDTSGSIGIVIPTIDISYTIHPRVSMGLHLEQNHFGAGGDSGISRIRSNGICLKGSYIFINNGKSIGFLSLITGPNYLKIIKPLESNIKASTINLQLELGLKNYFKGQWGYFTTFAFSRYKYSSLFQDGERLMYSNNGYKFDLNGVHLRAGLTYKFKL